MTSQLRPHSMCLKHPSINTEPPKDGSVLPRLLLWINSRNSATLFERELHTPIKKRSWKKNPRPLFYDRRGKCYIMPSMPGAPGIRISGLSSFFSTITHSVVRNIPAIEAAFSKAMRVTLAGSTTPAACIFS